MTGPEKDTDDARAAVTGTGLRYVFVISTAAAAIALLSLALHFMA